MKKIITIIVIVLLTPFAAFGLTALTDCEMNNITGQAGVSIDPEINLRLHVDTVAWGDSDSGVTSIIGVGVTDLNATLQVGVRNDYINNINNNVELITIDVAKDTAETEPLYNGATYVRIGLGTFEVTSDINFDGNVNTTLIPLISQLQFGNMNILGLQILTHEGGFVDITTMGRNSGVTLGLNVLLDEINIDSLAWGIPIPILGKRYIGLANTAITDFKAIGALRINTNSNEANSNYVIDDSDVKIHVGTFAATVAVGRYPDLRNNIAGIPIYLEDVTFDCLVAEISSLMKRLE